MRRPCRGIFFDDVGAGDVGRHQIRRKLDAVEIQAQNRRQSPDQQRLRGAGQSGNQAVAADKQGDHHLFDHFILAHDNAVNLSHDFVTDFLKPCDSIFQFAGVEGLYGDS